MIKVTVTSTKKFKNVDWGAVKHPTLVQHASGQIYITVPTSYLEDKNYEIWERDAICLIGRPTCSDKVGDKVYKLNLENCQLYDGSVTISNG